MARLNLYQRKRVISLYNKKEFRVQKNKKIKVSEAA